MSHGDDKVDGERIIRHMIARSTESAPTLAAAEIRRRATAEGTPVEVLVENLTVLPDAAEDEEIARIVRERPADGAEVPLADIARKFGVDLEEL